MSNTTETTNSTVSISDYFVGCDLFTPGIEYTGEEIHQAAPLLKFTSESVKNKLLEWAPNSPDFRYSAKMLAYVCKCFEDIEG